MNNQSTQYMLQREAGAMAIKHQDTGAESNSALSLSAESDFCSASSASFLAAAALCRFDLITVRGYIGKNPDRPTMQYIKKN